MTVGTRMGGLHRQQGVAAGQESHLLCVAQWLCPGRAKKKEREAIPKMILTTPDVQATVLGGL